MGMSDNKPPIVKASTHTRLPKPRAGIPVRARSVSPAPPAYQPLASFDASVQQPVTRRLSNTDDDAFHRESLVSPTELTSQETDTAPIDVFETPLKPFAEPKPAVLAKGARQRVSEHKVNTSPGKPKAAAGPTRTHAPSKQPIVESQEEDEESRESSHDAGHYDDTTELPIKRSDSHESASQSTVRSTPTLVSKTVQSPGNYQ